MMCKMFESLRMHAIAPPLVHEDDHGDVVPNAMCSSLDLIEWDPQPYNDSLGQLIQF